MTVIASGEIDLKLSKQSQTVLENDLAKAGNQAGQKSGAEFSKGFETTSSRLKSKVGDALKGAAKAAGPAIIAIGGALTKLGQSSEKATINLRRAVENTGTSFESFGKDLDGAIKQQAKFGTNSIDTTRALTTLTQKLQDPKKALEALALASDLAAAKNLSLEAATGLVTKAYSGNAKVLGQFGINIKDSKTAIADATKAQDAHRAAIDRLKEAQQNLSDLQAILAEKDKLTLQDQFRLRDAKQDVADAQLAVNTAAQNSVAAQERAKGAIQGTEEAVGKLRGQVQGLADEQAATLEGRFRTLRVQIQNAAIDLGDKFGPAITAVGTASTLAANAVALGLTPALIGLGLAYTGAAVAGAGLGVVLHNFIEEHAPGVNRALESIGGGLFDLGQKLIGASQQTGALGEAQRIFGLTGDVTTQKLEGQIKALQALSGQASGPTKQSIDLMVRTLESIKAEYRTHLALNDGATPTLKDIKQRLQELSRGVTVPVRLSSEGSVPRLPSEGRRGSVLVPGERATGGPVWAGDWLLGERGNGAEHLHLSPGSSGWVDDASKTQRMLGSSGPAVHIENLNVNEVANDPQATAFAVTTALGEKAQR